MVDIPGEPSGSNDNVSPFAAPVLRLNKLGFLLPFKAGGFINEGDVGSEAWKASTLGLRLRARLLGFLNFRGEGEVIGRSSFNGNRGGLVSTIFRL
jgi:hypothetical protein